MNAPRSPKRKRALFPIRSIISHGVFGALGFYFGLITVYFGTGNFSRSGFPSFSQRIMEGYMMTTSSSSFSFVNSPFPESTSNFVVDYTTVDRMELNALLDMGIPTDPTKKGAEDAVILYSGTKSLPSSTSTTTRLTATEATKNCHTVKVILTEPAKQGECLALMPQWESYHIHKFMRLPDYGGIDMKIPLRPVSRTADQKGREAGIPDYRLNTAPSYKALVDYLGALDDTLVELQPLLRTIATPKKSVIVSVVNYGQAVLFENFLCNARSKGLDTSHLLLFATDEKTYKLAMEYGVTVYYNEAIFGDLPENAAGRFGDRIFSRMMMAKVYCVHLVISCGYNVLFQDVDMVWYRDPLPFLESRELSEWDMIFQDDGARANRFAPYSPNTGFYYVRYSSKTLFFFGMLLRSGDSIAKTKSHQTALAALLNEHVSWKGLRVKVWRKGEGNPFPGGVEYHQQADLMRRLLKRNQNALDERMGKSPTYPDTEILKDTPYIFHMSWTESKVNKKKYFQQMGEWYLKDECDDTGYECCLALPDTVCHYRDKPSLINCAKSPPIDRGHRSFW